MRATQLTAAGQKCSGISVPPGGLFLENGMLLGSLAIVQVYKRRNHQLGEATDF